MRDANTIVVAPTIHDARKAGWLGYTERHVITPRSLIRLRGRAIRNVRVVGYRRDEPTLAKVMDEVMRSALRYGAPLITYH